MANVERQRIALGIREISATDSVRIEPVEHSNENSKRINIEFPNVHAFATDYVPAYTIDISHIPPPPLKRGAPSLE